jgi:UDP-N-acetylmuramate--alanine ligase
MKGRFRGIDRIHFVGIGGIGMAGLAELLHAQGYTVTGSDLQAGPTVERLRGLGVDVAIGHAAAHAETADVLVVSSAIRAGNPEVAEAERRGIPVIPRAEMLAEMMRLHDGVAVAGTHGKTTTTSLVAHVLARAGLDPTAVIGGRVILGSALRTGARLGAGRLLVAEADESDGSFLRLAPVLAVVTNVEAEHLDHWGDAQALHAAFTAFANRVPFWGRAVLCLDDPGVQSILPGLTRRTVTCGLSPQADFVAREVATRGAGMRFEVARHGTRLGEVVLPLAGVHNVRNALLALAVAHELEVPFPEAAAALASFPGVERRFEAKGEARGVRVVDDYGHHPTEIRATLEAARGVHAGRLVVVFQPHRYTRTRDLFEGFAAAFHGADLLVLTPIYAAGEPKIPGVEAQALAEAIAARGHRGVRFVADLEAVPDALVPELRAGDLVLTLGAGNVGGLGPRLLDALRARGEAS